MHHCCTTFAFWAILESCLYLHWQFQEWFGPRKDFLLQGIYQIICAVRFSSLFQKKTSGIFPSEVIAPETITDWGWGNLEAILPLMLASFEASCQCPIIWWFENCLILNTASFMKRMLHWLAVQQKRLSRLLHLMTLVYVMCFVSLWVLDPCTWAASLFQCFGQNVQKLFWFGLLGFFTTDFWRVRELLPHPVY